MNRGVNEWMDGWMDDSQIGLRYRHIMVPFIMSCQMGSQRESIKRNVIIYFPVTLSSCATAEEKQWFENTAVGMTAHNKINGWIITEEKKKKLETRLRCSRLSYWSSVVNLKYGLDKKKKTEHFICTYGVFNYFEKEKKCRKEIKMQMYSVNFIHFRNSTSCVCSSLYCYTEDRSMWMKYNDTVIFV